MEQRLDLVRKASLIALVGNGALALLKLAIGFLSGSLAVVSDGVDSSTDVAIALMNLFAARIAAQPSDREHPYGHSRAETIATAALAFIVFFAGAQLFIGAAGSLLHGERMEMPGLAALFVTGLSIVGKLLLAWSQFAFGKRSGSALLVANGKNMRGDVVTSSAILVGLGLGYLLGIPILDRVLALLVAVWIVRNAVGIFMEANEELMDGHRDSGPYGEVFAAVASIPDAGNPHRTRIRRLGGLLVVDLDIEVDPEHSVREAHETAVRVEAAIKERLPEVYDVIVHIEPRGNLEEGERYGLRPESHVGA